MRRRVEWKPASWLLGGWPVAVLVLVGLAGIVRPAAYTHNRLLLAITLAAVAFALLRRRPAPLPVLAFVLVAGALANYGPITSLGTLLALLAVAILCDRRTVAVAAPVTAAVLIATPAIHGAPLRTAGPILSRLVAVGLAVAVGLYLRARADYIAGLRDRAERLERERELLTAQAVAGERVRIARELHDVVAHNVSLMVVQAQALAARGGEEAELAALNRIAGIGREALSEMHRMLGLLRVEGGGVAELEPQPGIADLEALVGRTRDTGLDVALSIEGETRELPPGIDLSAYRIVQEALTNVLKHADAQHASVTVAYRRHQLEVTVQDDGVGPAEAVANGAGGGHGLIGMRERVAVFGGEFEAGAGRGGRGFMVQARLPVS